MRNIITGLIILGILGGAAYFMMRSDSQENKIRTILKDRDFTVPREDIQKIFVAHKSLKPYTLEKKGDGWYYNDKFRVSDYVIPTVLAVFDRIQVNHIPPGPSVDNIVASMRRGGIKVEVYGKNDDLLKTMYVGSDVSQGNGTFMLLEGSSQPYAMELKNVNGGFRHRFMFTENQLRDRTVLAVDRDEVASFGVTYPNDPNQSWSIDVEGGDYVLTHEQSGSTTEPIDAVVEAYINGMKRVPLEGWDIGNKAQDSIALLEPFAQVDIELENGDLKVIKLIPFRDFLDPEVNIHEIEASKFVTRYYVVDEKGQLGIGQQRVMGGLLIGHDFFTQPL